MADFIDRALATSHPFANGHYDHENANEHFILGYESYREWLEDLPSADVRPVRRGRWIVRETAYEDTEARCSECGFTTLINEPGNGLHMLSDLNYCPDCGSYNGADMRGGDADGGKH